MIPTPSRSLNAFVAVLLFASTSPAWAQNEEGAATQPAATQPAASQSTEPVGDPYTLDVDPVTMDKLPNMDQVIIIDHEGRELRFGSTDSVEAFRGDPGRYLTVIDEMIVKQQLPYYPLGTCVVSGDKIGDDVGESANFVYKNRLIRFCCPGCKDDFKDNAADYLGKLDEAVKRQQMADYPLTTCPVSGNQLGAMGDPIDVVIANRLVRLCCESCIDKLRDNPTKYLGMLGGAGIEHAGHEGGEDRSKHDGGDGGGGHAGHNH